MVHDHIEVHPAWKELNISLLQGMTMVIGATDTGKSRFVQWLTERLASLGRRVAWLDGDVGQSTLGLPGTMNLAVLNDPPRKTPKSDATFFVGAVSPRGNMLPVLVGAHALREKARATGTQLVVYDTCGLVGEDTGGNALKQWKIELLRPCTIIALQRDRELEHLLCPLRLDPRVRLEVFPVAAAARRRSPEERTERRRNKFRNYFSGASARWLSTRNIPIFERPKADLHRLIGLMREDGLAAAAGLILSEAAGKLEVLTPLADWVSVRACRVGDLRIDPETGEGS